MLKQWKRVSNYGVEILSIDGLIFAENMLYKFCSAVLMSLNYASKPLSQINASYLLNSLA